MAPVDSFLLYVCRLSVVRVLTDRSMIFTEHRRSILRDRRVLMSVIDHDQNKYLFGYVCIAEASLRIYKIVEL